MMKLFTLKGARLVGVTSQPFKKEKDIQTLVESNLNELFGLELVRSEFPLKTFRIDTLGYDKENKSFVILEYKKDRNFSVIDQGYTYLSLMLNNKSDFILEYNENCKNNLKRDDVDWSQSRVIFISTNFTEYQKNSVNFKDVPFELWEINRYDNGVVALLEHKTSSNVSISTIKTDAESVVRDVTKEIKVYTEEYHFTKNSRRKEYVIDLYQALKERILNLGQDTEIIHRKEYIDFKRKKPFADIVFYTDHLKLLLNMKKGELDDPKKVCRDMSSQGHWGNGDYEVRIDLETDLDYVMFLVNQSYKKQD
jgi:predicted transport protein